MVGRVITSNSIMQSITVVPPEDVMVVPQFGKARFGASSYDAEQLMLGLEKHLVRMLSCVGKLLSYVCS